MTCDSDGRESSLRQILAEKGMSILLELSDHCGYRVLLSHNSRSSNFSEFSYRVEPGTVSVNHSYALTLRPIGLSLKYPLPRPASVPSVSPLENTGSQTYADHPNVSQYH